MIKDKELVLKEIKKLENNIRNEIEQLMLENDSSVDEAISKIMYYSLFFSLNYARVDEITLNRKTKEYFDENKMSLLGEVP